MVTLYLQIFSLLFNSQPNFLVIFIVREDVKNSTLLVILFFFKFIYSFVISDFQPSLIGLGKPQKKFSS